VVNVSGQNLDSIRFWAALLAACCAIILALVVHVLYSLSPPVRRKKMAAISNKIMRRDMDRLAEYLDGLANSGPSVRQPFELGLAAMQTYNWSRAIELFREAMMQARGAEIVALFNLSGVCHYTQGRLDDARTSFEEAARLAEQFEDEDGKAPALGNIGVIYHDLGELDRALEYKEQALAKAHQLGDQWAEAIYLANIGNIWHDKGDLDKAMEYHEQALELSRGLGDKWGVASDLASIASILRDKGSLDEALKFDREALSIAHKIGHRLGVVTDLRNIASIYRYQGKLGEALRYGEAALAEARKVGYRLGVAADLGNIGLILTDQHKYEKAVPKLAESLVILLAGGFADGPRQVVTGLVKCEDKLGRERMEGLLKDAGLDEHAAADLLDRVDQMRLKKPEPEDTQPA
jgi:tetratricopeptide (TPR) repeat protein